MDKLSKEKEEELGISERKLEVPLPSLTLKIFFSLIFLFLILLLGKSYQMQVIHGESYSTLADRNKFTIFYSQSLRGVIYDRFGEQMVFNNISFDLYLNKREFSSEKTEELSILLDDDSLEERISQIEGRELLLSGIDHEKAILLKAREGDFPGISIEKVFDRQYKEGDIFSHLIGYTGKVSREELLGNPDRYLIHDYVGKSGVEKFYEEFLSKERREIRIERDSQGNVIEEESIKEPDPGDSLVLWLDSDLQRVIKEAAERVLEDIGAKSASVVAMDPETGGILSMVSLPGYDNNVFSRTGDKELLESFLKDEGGVFLNRTIGSTYPTGSAIKPLLAAAALEEEIISPQKKIYSPGYLDIPNPWDPSRPTRIRDYLAHGWTDMREAIAVSSNVYFYTIGGGHGDQEGLGVSRIKKYLDLFGWGEKTGIDLTGEKEGQVPDADWKREVIGAPWTLGDTYNISIGQGYLSTTPLQVAVSYSALINGGRVLEPRVVKEIINSEERKEIESKVIRENFISPENLEVIKEGMRMTVTQGTARSLNSLPVRVGAKTGTAQIPKPGHYHNWIAVFGPYDNPEIVLVILIEEVEGVRAATIPVALEVLEWYFNRDL